MDSFCEMPRSAPIPSSVENIAVVPVVPEVSICQNNSTQSQSSMDSIYLTYSSWKARNQNETNGSKGIGYLHSQTTGTIQISDDINLQNVLKRQVRFDSPYVQENLKQKCLNNDTKITTTTSTPPIFPSYLSTINDGEDKSSDLSTKSNKPAPPFEQIYMANIPSRQLDLSIVDVPRLDTNKENIENISPNINLSSTNTLPYKQHLNIEEAVKNTKFFNNKKQNFKENKSNDYNISSKFNGWFNNQNKSDESVNINFNQFQDSNQSGVTDKNRLIDQYNYKNQPLRNFQNLDNLKICDIRNQDSKSKIPLSLDMCDSLPHNCTPMCCCSCDHKKNLLKNDVYVPSKTVAQTNDNEPTVKDLLKIIQQQNDQLLLLQKQVATLLNNRDMPKQIEAPPTLKRSFNLFGEQYQTSTQLEVENGFHKPNQNFLPQKGPLRQISLDVMTSFEVSIRRQQNLNRVRNDGLNHQPKICEVTESDGSHCGELFNSKTHPQLGKAYGVCRNGSINCGILRNTDVSLSFNQPLQIQETCPTPMNSINIDMKDYSSDSDQEDSTGPGWTLYNNMMGQVNHILRKSGIRPCNISSTVANEHLNDPVKQNLKKRVKEATVKHLRSIGVDVPMNEDTNDLNDINVPNGMDCNTSEVSFMVKQLLMKYLPDDQLAKVTCMPEASPAPLPVSKETGLIKRKPEFSFATLQYMQKYNLLNDVPNKGRSNQQANPQQDNFDRILDITAIKQQPKLL